jgi:hypothetical protein
VSYEGFRVEPSLKSNYPCSPCNLRQFQLPLYSCTDARKLTQPPRVAASYSPVYVTLEYLLAPLRIGWLEDILALRTLGSTSSASQKANLRLLDLTRLNELCLTSSFDLPKGHWPERAWAMGFYAQLWWPSPTSLSMFLHCFVEFGPDRKIFGDLRCHLCQRPPTLES